MKFPIVLTFSITVSKGSSYKIEVESVLLLSCLCFRCCEKDSLDGTLRRIIAQKEANTQKHVNGNIANVTGGQGLWTSLKLLRGDPKQVSLEIKLFCKITLFDRAMKGKLYSAILYA